MSRVEPVRTTSPVQSDTGREPRATTEGVSLLPPPSESQLDALGVLYALYAKNRVHNLKVTRSDLEAAQKLRRKAWEKVKQALADALTSGFLIFYLVLLLIGGISGTMYALTYGQKNYSSWAPPLAPIKIIMCIGIALMLLQVVAVFFKDVAKARGEPLA